jgi:hypothetical protein
LINFYFTLLDPQSRKKQIGKETVIDETCCVIRIQTNRKPVWQKELSNSTTIS